MYVHVCVCVCVCVCVRVCVCACARVCACSEAVLGNLMIYRPTYSYSIIYIRMYVAN